MGEAINLINNKKDLQTEASLKVKRNLHSESILCFFSRKFFHNANNNLTDSAFYISRHIVGFNFFTVSKNIIPNNSISAKMYRIRTWNGCCSYIGTNSFYNITKITIVYIFWHVCMEFKTICLRTFCYISNNAMGF